jgi:dTDP-4-amino-4,6-dideoxygalactose transaminase
VPPEAAELARPASRRRASFLPFARPEIGNEEIAEVVECLRSGWITTGPRTERFEKDFAAYVGVPHALAFASGTAALHCAFWLLDLRPGDEVIVPSLTWPATANMAAVLGARVIFADIDPVTLQLSPEDAARKVTERTRAIVPVHFGGAPANLDALRELAGSRIAIVEDAAHAVGAEHRGARIGVPSARGSCAFSFHPIKGMTTVEGGMLVVGDEDSARRARLFRFHGVSRDAWTAYGSASAARYDCVMPGFKYNLTDVASAVGIHQLRKLDGFIERRTRIAEFYRRRLVEIPSVTLPQPPAYPHRHAWGLFPVLVDRRDEFLAGLRVRNVGAGIHFEALHRTGLYRSSSAPLPVTEQVCARILSLPLFPGMSDEDAGDVVEAVADVARERAGQTPGGAPA